MAEMAEGEPGGGAVLPAGLSPDEDGLLQEESPALKEPAGGGPFPLAEGQRASLGSPTGPPRVARAARVKVKRRESKALKVKAAVGKRVPAIGGRPSALWLPCPLLLPFVRRRVRRGRNLSGFWAW